MIPNENVHQSDSDVVTKCWRAKPKEREGGSLYILLVILSNTIAEAWQVLIFFSQVDDSSILSSNKLILQNK